MGEIQRQAIKGTIYTYIGIAIGFLTSGLLFPRFFSTEQIGLVNVIVSYAIITAQFASLGFNGVLTRFFPYFRNTAQKHHGFLTIGITTITAGFVLASLILWILNAYGLLSTSKSTMLSSYFPTVYLLIFVILFFNFFDNYAKVMYNAVIGTLLKEFVQRLFILIAIGLFIFHIATFDLFYTLYVFAYAVPFLVIVFYLYQHNLLVFSKPSLPDKVTVKEMATMALFSIFSGLAGVLTVNIDRIMVQNYTGLGNAGIYTIMFFFGSIVAIPSRSLIKISSTYVADAWKENDLKTIDQIYKKSVVNQTIIGSFILLLLWGNIDNVFPVIGNKYLAGKYVVLFVGLSYLTDMLVGTANTIIATSKEFKKITYIIIIQGILIIITNIVFIKLFGLVGAAIGSFVSKLISNTLKAIVIKNKFHLFPYNGKVLLILVSSIIAYIPAIFLSHNHLIVSILLKTLPSSLIFILLVNYLKISDELNFKNLKNLIKSVK